MNNRDKLKDLMVDVLLLTPGEFTFDLKREDVPSWDSLAIVSIAVGVEEVFGYHCTPEEATKISSIGDIIALLQTKGIQFE